ncbi:hypothetical protein B566_EDAN014914 [Ephemera danica]|nr:hypothetical protein B566_EDAN014914 [Ephemera danica]
MRDLLVPLAANGFFYTGKFHLRQLAVPFTSMLNSVPPVDDPGETELVISCMICHNTEAVYLLLPCGHLGVCDGICLSYVRDKMVCPFCRQKVGCGLNFNLVSLYCMRCNSRRSDVCNMPCRHVCLCQPCYLDTRNCPSCQVQYRQYTKIFFCFQ